MESILQTVARQLALLLVCAAPLTMADTLLPFKSDGCSLFPNGTPARPLLWCGCCVAHDLAYWQGGSVAARLQADAELHRCVRAAAGSNMLGALMQAGVRAGGQPGLPSSFRWGYGWPQRSGYLELDGQDKALVRQRLKEHPYAAEMALRCVAPAEASGAR